MSFSRTTQSNTTRRGERYLCMPLFVCVRCGRLSIYPHPCLKSRGLYPAVLFLYSYVTVLCKKKLCGQTPDKETDYILNRAGIFFTFSLNVFCFLLEVTKFLSSVQTETKNCPQKTQSEVLSMTFFKSWSMYVIFFSWAVRLTRGGKDK